MHEAKSGLSRLVKLAESGEEVVIQRAGRPAVQLVPVVRKRPIADAVGVWRGRVRIADDFDELPADLAEHFGG